MLLIFLMRTLDLCPSELFLFVPFSFCRTSSALHCGSAPSGVKYKNFLCSFFKTAEMLLKVFNSTVCCIFISNNFLYCQWISRKPLSRIFVFLVLT